MESEGSCRQLAPGLAAARPISLGHPRQLGKIERWGLQCIALRCAARACCIWQSRSTTSLRNTLLTPRMVTDLARQYSNTRHPSALLPVTARPRRFLSRLVPRTWAALTRSAPTSPCDSSSCLQPLASILLRAPTLSCHKTISFYIFSHRATATPTSFIISGID